MSLTPPRSPCVKRFRCSTSVWGRRYRLRVLLAPLATVPLSSLYSARRQRQRWHAGAGIWGVHRNRLYLDRVLVFVSFRSYEHAPQLCFLGGDALQLSLLATYGPLNALCSTLQIPAWDSVVANHCVMRIALGHAPHARRGLKSQCQTLLGAPPGLQIHSLHMHSPTT